MTVMVIINSKAVDVELKLTTSTREIRKRGEIRENIKTDEGQEKFSKGRGSLNGLREVK